VFSNQTGSNKSIIIDKINLWEVKLCVNFFKLTALTISMMLLVVCLTGPQVSAASRPEGWTEETHGKKATPNYSVVFPEDKVNRIDIIISPENFQRMENDVFKVFMMSNEDPIYVSATVKFTITPGGTWESDTRDRVH